MKNFLLVFVLTLGLMAAKASVITQSEAERCAEAFLAAKEVAKLKGTKTVPSKTLKLAEGCVGKPYFAFNIDGEDGFVIVSTVGDEPMVIGYSEKSTINLNNLPPQLKAVLADGNAYKLKEAKKATGNETGLRYDTPEWGQGAPYNNLCPIIGEKRAPAGCVATAMAIVMKYHNWPDHTQGGEEWNWYHKDLTFDFDNYIIDWDALSDMNNSKFADEVAKLHYSAGITAPMMYGEVESGAEVWPVSHKLIYNYSYSKDCQYIEKNSFENEEWDAMLKQQLLEVGPVIYRGGIADGHCFVIDGFDADGYYHVNWGWDGQSNGYWALDFSNVGGLDFSEYQGMIINIKPDRNHPEYSRMFIPNAAISINPVSNMWNFSSPDIIPDKLMKIKLPAVVLNKMIGFLCIGIVDENDEVVAIADARCAFDDVGLYCAYPCSDPIFEVALPALKPGQRYQLISKEFDISDFDGALDLDGWKIVLGGMKYPSYFYDQGNFSYMVEINYHIADNAPVFMELNMNGEKEYTEYKLWGGDGPENYICPSKGISYRVTCTDREGNQAEPVYVASYDDNYKMFMTNVSIYQHHYDIYIDYEYDGDTRHDGDLEIAAIVEKDGLVYKVDGNTVSLIGYDKVGDVVEIPSSLQVEGQKHPVKGVAQDALLFAPIKELIINDISIDETRFLSFACMKDLQSLTVKNFSFHNNWFSGFGYAFLESDLKEAYIGVNPTMELIRWISHGNFGLDGFYIANPDIDYYIGALPISDNAGVLRELNEYKNIYSLEKVVGSYNIPGLGNCNLNKEIKQYDLPINQMWEYEIDKRSGLVRIGNVKDNVEIVEVLINGNKVENDGSDIYSVPGTNTDFFEVSVKYLINGTKDMVTTYTATYNTRLQDSPYLSGMGNIVQDDYTDKVMNIFNLQGVCLNRNATASDIEVLPAGVYVVNGKKLIVK